MLNFADRTGCGALMVMWPYILFATRQWFINLIAADGIFVNCWLGNAYFAENYVRSIKHAVEYFAQLDAWPSNVPQRQSGP